MACAQAGESKNGDGDKEKERRREREKERGTEGERDRGREGQRERRREGEKERVSVHCPPSICHPPWYSNHVVDCFCVPSVLRFQSPDFTSSDLNAPSAFPMKHSALLYRIPSQIP